MKKTTVIEIVGGSILTIGGAIAAFVRKKRGSKKKDISNSNTDLIKNFEALRTACLNSSEASLRALQLMDQLQDEIDKKFGIEPTEIETDIPELLSQEAKA